MNSLKSLNFRITFSCLVLIVCLILPVTAFPDDNVSSLREIVKKWNDSVITVKVVTNLRVIVEGREVSKTDNEVEAVGTLVDPSGLSVLSSSSIDPSRIYSEIVKQAKSSGEGPKFDIETEISDIKMIMPDGNELPAKIVMKDSDLDLAYVKPVAKLDKPVHALDFSKERKADILDDILILTRSGKAAGRIPSVSMHKVEAVIKKPRTFYVIDQKVYEGKIGAPVFSPDGKVVGVLVLRIVRSDQKGSFISNALGVNTTGIMSVILPAEDVVEASKQALEVKDQEKAEDKK